MKRQQGFTLIEAVMAIVITGIIAGMVALFIARPVEGYVDSVRRAALTDAADLALKRIALEIRRAVPNTVRVAGGGTLIEFIPASDGGRYRAETGSAGDNPLDFTAAGDSFDVLGTVTVPAAVGGVFPQLIVFNTGQSGLDAYVGQNRRNITSAGAAAAVTSSITFSGAALPFQSPSRRFQIVRAVAAGEGGPVAFQCETAQSGEDGPLVIARYGGYGYGLAGVTTPASGTRSLLVDSIPAGGCSFAYADGVLATNGLLALSLKISRAGEAVTLHEEIHVDNMP